MTKMCSSCKEALPVEDFAFKNRATGHRQSKCRECAKSYGKKHYESHRSDYIARARKKNAETTEAKRAYVAKLRNRPCMDCGGVFPEPCMDFDHRSGRTVKGSNSPETIANMKNDHKGIACLMAEIEKCDVVCANCHRLRTHKRKTRGL